MSDHLAAATASSAFHRGEQAMQTRAGVRDKLEALGSRMIRDFMPDQHRELFQKLPMVVLGSQDASGQPWASVLCKPEGLMHSDDPRHLAIHALPAAHDPLAANLRPGAALGMLGIEPHTRRRNRMNGKVTACHEDGFELAVIQSFGNCPKYIQARSPLATLPERVAGQPSESATLDAAMQAIIARADTYFIATAWAADTENQDSADNASSRGVDVSHRGGKPGFVRVDDASTLTAPDFLGNFFFNTLGNLCTDPRAGLLFIDFASGDLLYLAVQADIIWDEQQVAAYAGAQRLLRFHITHCKRVPAAMPLAWGEAELSPVLATTGAWETPTPHP